jgi:hypothetical protein
MSRKITPVAAVIAACFWINNSLNSIWLLFTLPALIYLARELASNNGLARQRRE